MRHHNNWAVTLSHILTVFPPVWFTLQRTHRLPKEMTPVEPSAFAAQLITKLEKLKRERDTMSSLEERLQQIQEVHKRSDQFISNLDGDCGSVQHSRRLYTHFVMSRKSEKTKGFESLSWFSCFFSVSSPISSGGNFKLMFLDTLAVPSNS